MKEVFLSRYRKPIFSIVSLLLLLLLGLYISQKPRIIHHVLSVESIYGRWVNNMDYYWRKTGENPSTFSEILQLSKTFPNEPNVLTEAELMSFPNDPIREVSGLETNQLFLTFYSGNWCSLFLARNEKELKRGFSVPSVENAKVSTLVLPQLFIYCRTYNNIQNKFEDTATPNVDVLKARHLVPDEAWQFETAFLQQKSQSAE